MCSLKIVFLLLANFIYISTASVGVVCPGCERERDVNDPLIKSTLSTAILHFSSELQGTDQENIDLIEIKKVTTQVISGLKYNFYFDAKGVKTQALYDCHLTILIQKWSNKETVSKYYCEPHTSTKIKRSLVGSPVSLDVDQYEYLLKKKDAIGLELSKQQKNKYLLGIVNIFDATQQVVAGILTKFTAEVAMTNCLLSDENIGACKALFQEKGHQVCNIELWEKPWLNKWTMNVKECNDVPYFCAGCPVDVSPNDEQAQQCLKRTLFNLNAKSHSKKQWKLRSIVKIQSQVVAGLKYIIDFEAEDENQSPYMCRAVIVSQPWISKEPMVDDFECVLETQSSTTPSY